MIELNKIYNEDNLETMNKMEDDYIDGIITSPPYNIATKRKDCYYNNGYSHKDNLTTQDYLKTRTNEFKEFSRILKSKGVICYNISYHSSNPILPIQLMNKIHEETDLTIADMISWKKSHAIPFQTSPTKLSRIVEQIYIIVHKDFLHKFNTNKKISKINEKTGQKFYKNVSNFVEAPNNDGIKSKLKSSYSEELVLKLIDIYFPEYSLIYDPFMGIATTARACLKANLNFIGSEQDEEIYTEGLKTINNL